MSKTASLVTKNGVTAFVNGKSYFAAPTHKNFEAVLTAIKADQWDRIPALIDLREGVRKWLTEVFTGDFKLVGDNLHYKGYTFGERVTQKALDMIDAGNNSKPLLKFLSRVIDNPREAAREELLLFCEANGFMISSEGMIVAYKKVRNDYMDLHSGTVRYRVGDVPEMDRLKVDDNRYVTCSSGLHFAARDYALGFGSGRMMVVEVDPADVVAIPNDYANQKGRAWRMRVIAEIDNAQPLPKREVYDYDAKSGEWGDAAESEVDEALDGDENEDEEFYYASYDDDGNDLYQLGQKHGRNRRGRVYLRGENEAYDSGYKVGRGD